MLSKFNNKKHRRLTALLLCVALMLGSVTSVSADISAADSETEAQSEVQTYAEEPMAEAVSYETPETEARVVETEVAETEAVTEAATEVHTEAATEVHTEAETEAAQSETTEEPKVSEAVQLTQDMKNAEGKTICKVIADLPEGAFNADASEITMEVKAVSSEDEEAVVKLIKNALTENTSLGNYVMYHITFKVNGQNAEPQKAISIAFKGTELNVQDTEKATVFYYNPANSDAGNKDAELVPIIQRDALIKALHQEEKEIPDNFDEIYDTSEIVLTDKGIADEIQMDTWKDRIYGCYVTETQEAETEVTEEDSVSRGQSKLVSFRNVYTANGGGSGDEPEASLSHEKYIKRNVDGTYDITLNASGTVGSKTNPAKVDIVLIVDTSGSMKDNHKLDTTKAAISSLVDVFNAKGDSVDVKYKLVKFAKYASIVTDGWVNGKTLYDKVKSLKADGGTNYDQGFQKGKTAIDSARSDAKKVVIFLTDGQPTYYGTRPYGYGSDTSTTTLTTALNSAATITCTDFYAVGIGLPNKVRVYTDDGDIDEDYKDLTGQGVLDLIKNQVNAATTDAWNLTKDADGTYSSLTNKFQQIAGQTLTAACSNVVITDQLSKYVDVTDSSRLRVKVAERNTAGAYSDKYSHDFTLDVTGNDAKVTVDDEDIATVSYNAETKTATLDFTDSYKLEANYYYYLTITNVIPNETAFKQYVKNKYGYGGTVGDPSTDEGQDGYYATNNKADAATKVITSSGQPGFVSNKKATVSYKKKESGSTITEEYAKPVVQVQTIPVKKVWSGAEPDDGTKILVQLVDQKGDPVEGKILELSKDNNWQNKLVVEKASKYDSYSYRELVADEKGSGSITYKDQKYSMASEGSDLVINDKSYKVTYSNDEDGTRVITNTYPANGGGSGDEPEASLSHEKYIKRNVDGTYDITLNASGTVGSKTNPAKVDIVLIVDTSGSMKDNHKLDTTKAAISSLVDVFNAKGDSVDVKYKLVKFAKYASIVTDGWVNGKTLYDKVKSLKADGGTNYDQGFQKGKTAIDSARSDAKKVVIFLTDGQPTYYGTRPYGYGSDTSTTTLTTALNSAATITCTDFYAVGIGLPNKVRVYTDDGDIDEDYKDLTGQGVLDLIKNQVNAATTDAWNLTKDADGTYSSLTNKFQQIAGQTLTAACSNVVITDQLSKYVDVTDSSRLRVKVAERNTAGAYSDKYSHDFTLDVTGNDAKVTVDDEDIATVSYNAETKTATLDFTDSYKLEANYYYYLTITNVIPNETAFKQYVKNKYGYGGTVGDPSTDEGQDGYYATNNKADAATKVITSSGQPGFVSNKKATVSYKKKESGSTITEEYAKPVVQVQTIPVKKVWSGAEPDDGTKILVQLVDQKGDPVEGKILELSKDNNWQNKLVVEKASKYDSYSYRELVANENGSITYKDQKYSMASEGSDIVINHTSYKVTYEDDTRVITNTKNDQSMKIVKQNNSGINLEGATFTLKDAQNQSTEYTSDANGIVFNNNINYGTYTLKEIKAPNGYALLNADITITVDQSGITVSGSDKVSVSEDGTYTVIVKNDMLYSLPSTGGSGIYWFSICGMLLMMAAAWIIYKNKCREVLVK